MQRVFVLIKYMIIKETFFFSRLYEDHSIFFDTFVTKILFVKRKNSSCGEEHFIRVNEDGPFVLQKF